MANMQPKINDNWNIYVIYYANAYHNKVEILLMHVMRYSAMLYVLRSTISSFIYL